MLCHRSEWEQKFNHFHTASASVKSLAWAHLQIKQWREDYCLKYILIGAVYYKGKKWEDTKPLQRQAGRATKCFLFAWRNNAQSNTYRV